jgi:inorganic pyrophosphatase
MFEVDVIIEISKGGNVKYEFDKEKNILVCDRVLHTPFKYPFNYGYIPNTLSEDGDPIDVVVVMEESLISNCIVRCEIIGMLETKDDAGNDPKLIVCPIKKVDPNYDLAKKIYEIWYGPTLDKIKYFFKHYKDLENKTTVIGEFKDNISAYSIYQQSVKRFTNKNIQKSKITDYFKRI